jgi:AraC-like DNA-binding protein
MLTAACRSVPFGRPAGSTAVRRGGAPCWAQLEPRVEVRVEPGWAARAACHAVREVGATPVVGASYAVPLPRPSPPAALVYDLSPWDPTAVAYLERRALAAERIPILLYLPPTGAAFAALSRLPRTGYLGVQIQARDAESLDHLRAAATELVLAIPRVRILRRLTETVPGLSGAAVRFGQRALRALGAGQRPTVQSVARGLGVSSRTLQRRFQDDGLPAPKAFLDWLTLQYLQAEAESREVTAARVAARSGITSNDLYRMRKRVRAFTASGSAPTGTRLTASGTSGPLSGRPIRGRHPAASGTAPGAARHP